MFHAVFAMEIQTWMRDRNTKGTLPAIARKMLRSGEEYRHLERQLRGLYVLEALLEHRGNQRQTAEALGVSRETIKRVMRSFRLRAGDVRVLVQQIGDGK